MLRLFKNYLKGLRDNFYSKKIKNKLTFGSKSCAWTFDGDLLNKKSIVISGGAGKDISFEIEMAKEYGCMVHLFDPSPTGIETFNQLDSEYKKNILYYPLGLSEKKGIIRFSYPDNEKEGSYRISSLRDDKTTQFNTTSIKSFCKENDIKKIDLLKIDIEGFEYEVINDILVNEIIVKQILVEFHHFFDHIDKRKTNDSIKLLKQNGYELFHRREVDFSFRKKK